MPTYPVEPVLRVLALLHREPKPLHAALARLEEAWGPLDFVGPDRPFNVTQYYEDEMGRDLCRRWVGFARMIDPAELAASKLLCMQVEQQTAEQGKRRVNLDVGCLDHAKLVLASVKPAGQKIYLGAGVYADLVAKFKGGRYQPFEWTFPDLAEGRYDEELAELRRRLLERRRLGA